MRSLFLMLGLTISFPLFAQTEQTYSYVSPNSLPLSIPIMPIRQISGGTKITTTYTGEWPNEAKNAFEYACKILEESIPTTFPIKLLVNWSNQHQSNNNFSSFGNTLLHAEIEDEYILRTELKGLMYDQMCGGATSTAFVDDFCQIDWINDTHDATITYYNHDDYIVDNCDFSIADTQVGKYDFVSLALRDIVKALGFTFSKLSPAVIPQRLNRPNHFERLVLSSDQVLFSNNLTQTLTSGNFNLTSTHGNYNLYAPNPWAPELSLNYFIPDSKKITQLLRYDFGRESMVRDINDPSTKDFFKEILGWKGDIADGINNNEYYNLENTTTSQVIPYRGSIGLSEQPMLLNPISNINQNNVESSTTRTNNFKIENLSSSPDTYSYVMQYHPCYNGTQLINEGWVVSILLKDGSWDVIYSLPIGIWDLELDYNDLNFHFNDSAYARTIDGYLRCRITKRNNGRTKIWNYVIDDIPQKTKMKLSKVSAYYDDEYLRTVRIGLLDIEGTDSLVVKQHDEGYSQAYYYSVPDFKKGYVNVIVDRDFTSTIQIYAYNKNGVTISDNYIINPVDPSGIDISFNIINDEIELTAKSRRYDAINMIKECNIQSIIDGQKKSIKFADNKNKINISSLKQGMYIINVIDVSGVEHTFKFRKN